MLHTEHMTGHKTKQGEFKLFDDRNGITEPHGNHKMAITFIIDGPY